VEDRGSATIRATDARRAALVERLADHVLAHGLGAASLRQLARTAGTSDRMLLYYFPDKEALMAAVLQALAGRLTATLEAAAGAPMPAAALRPRLTALLLDDAMWPYMRVWLELAARAAAGDKAAQAVGGALARGFLHWVETQLDEGSTEEAARLLATAEGQVLLKALGLEAVARAAG
jgi:AcrR family transcriptional regulator